MKLLLWGLPFLAPFTTATPRASPHSSFRSVSQVENHIAAKPSIPFTSTLTVPRLVVYVQTFTTPDKKPLSLLPLLEYETKVTHVILASVHLHQEPGVIRLNDDPFDSPKYDLIWEEVKILQKHGVKVMILLGGAAAGTYIHFSGTEKEFYSYYHPLLHLIKRYNLDGIDIDVEEEVDISVPLRLLNAFYRDLGSSFLQTLAPLSSAISDPDGQNPSGFSYFDLDNLATIPGSETKLVSWYNGMFYGGFSRGPPLYQSVVKAGFEAERVVMGVLDCADDGQPNGFVQIEALGQRIRDLREMYEEFGGVAGWEYYDAGLTDREDMQPWEWVKEVGKALFDPLVKGSEL